MYLALLAAAVDDAAALPAWAQLIRDFMEIVVGPAIIALLAIIGQRLNASQKATKAAVEEVKVAAEDTAVRVRETERKVTSNHGRDNIGDKVDELTDDMKVVKEGLAVLPEVVQVLKEFGGRIATLEDTAHEAAAQVADNTVVAASVYEDLRHDIEDIAPPKAADGKRYCRRKHCAGNCGYLHRP